MDTSKKKKFLNVPIHDIDDQNGNEMCD